MERASMPRAWQPLTFGGVASFADASLTRLWIVQLIISFLVAGSVLWLLKTGWFPTIQRAISALPEGAAIRRQQLNWPGESPPAILAEDQFLSIDADWERRGPSNGQSADVRLSLGKTELRVQSLLGFVSLPYPADWTVSLSRTDATAWWGAWRSFLLIGAALSVILALFLGWLTLACLYSFPTRWIAFYLDRKVTWWGCWRLAGAAVLPGAVVMAAAILLYALRRLDLVTLLFAWLLHLVIGWIYVAYSPTRLPRLVAPSSPRNNPFRNDT